MSSSLKRILIVDDEPNIRTMMTLLLAAKGYETSSAEDGFDALLKMKKTMPDMVVSDLNMPHMSGFELLSVLRRRFPGVLVIAMSGAYDAASAVPGGAIADGFYAKGGEDPGTLTALVANLLGNSGSRSQTSTRESATVWVPLQRRDQKEIPYIVLTCTECLRSFPLDVPLEVAANVMKTSCIFCLTDVGYIIDSSLLEIPPKRTIATRASSGGSY